MSKIKSIITTIAIACVATLTMTCTAFALTRISGDDIAVCSLTHAGTGYWYGEENSNAISTYRNTYSDSQYASMIVSGCKATIRGANSYAGNYKFAAVTLVNNNYSKYGSNSGTSKSVSASASITGKIAHASYFTEIYNGTDSGSSFLDGYIVDVIDDSL